MFFFMSLLLSCHYRQVSCGIVLFLLEKKRSPLFRGGTRVLHGAPHAREHHQIPEGPKQNNAFFFLVLLNSHCTYLLCPHLCYWQSQLDKKKKVMVRQMGCSVKWLTPAAPNLIVPENLWYGQEQFFSHQLWAAYFNSLLSLTRRSEFTIAYGTIDWIDC